jgi:hypothetical protein
VIVASNDLLGFTSSIIEAFVLLSVHGVRSIFLHVHGSMNVMKPTWCTIYLQFIEPLHLYMFRTC